LDINVHVSWYQAVDMHYIMVPVKYDGGSNMSVLRNKQLFTKKGGPKVCIFQKVPIFKTISNPDILKKDSHLLGKSPTFFMSQFFA
jgi:hypothetical protein